MSELEQTIHNAARMGYKAAENGENLDEILEEIKTTEEKQ